MIVKEFWNENNKDLPSNFAMRQSPVGNKTELIINMKSIFFATVYQALLILTFSEFEKNLISSSGSYSYQRILEREQETLSLRF